MPLCRRTNHTSRTYLLAGINITEDELYQHIKELPQKPLFIGIEGLRLSLAGAQDKAAICIINNQVALPRNGCPTTHILKPGSPRFGGMVENEYFIMKVAKQVGLSVPHVELRKIKDVTFLLIERYDRKIKNNYIQRVHQEDFCQALSIKPKNKYQNEGGPSLKNCFELLNSTIQPAINRNRLASAVIFNYLIGNRDAHGKNFSLLHITKSDIQLAPFYDLVCTRVYPELTSKMAMKIGNKYEAEHILPKHWKQFCEEVNYRYLALEQLIETLEIKQAAIPVSEEMQASGIATSIINKVINTIENNINETLLCLKK